MITQKEFDRLIRVHRIRGTKTVKALRLVLVDGRTGADAAREALVDQGVISRGLAKLARPTCSKCGQAMP